jgi:hypothetical protein
MVIAVMATSARSGVEINATCASEVTRAPAHLRTLKSEIARALQGLPATSRYTLDVALVRLDATPDRCEIAVRAEVRAMLSDCRGRMVWTSTSRSTAHGPAKDRSLVEQDAVINAAQQVGRLVRTRCADGACR